MQRAPRDVLPNQPKKERVSNPTPYPSAHMMTAAIVFWRVKYSNTQDWSNLSFLQSATTSIAKGIFLHHLSS